MLLILYITILYCKKMDRYGICGIGLKLFEDYLSKTMQYVISHPMKKIIVEYHRVLCWVPCCLYINNLTSVSEFCFSVLFADDIDVFINGKCMDILCHQPNEDMINVQEWLECNKLPLMF